MLGKLFLGGGVAAALLLVAARKSGEENRPKPIQQSDIPMIAAASESWVREDYDHVDRSRGKHRSGRGKARIVELGGSRSAVRHRHARLRARAI